MKLFLDDERFPPGNESEWVIVRSFKEFTLYIENNTFPSLISFDHDLGDCPSGMDCVKWLVNWLLDHGHRPFEWTVHSMNPVGAENIKSYLLSYERSLCC